MANLKNYRQWIEQVLTEYAKSRNLRNDEVEVQTIFDRKHDHYQLIYIGWHNQKRIFGPVIHFDIKNDKIWIQWNGTEEDVAEELVKLGVNKEDVVLGFHTPFMRQFTDYAVG